MTAEEYIKKVNGQIQSVFDSSVVQNKDVINNGIDFSKSLQTWLEIIPEDNYKILLTNSIQSLELSIISQTYCLYRNAFSSLRLSMEMLFGGVFFSTATLDFIEWTKSSKDLNWSTINDLNNGVLSHRFCNAFFSELKENNEEYYTKAKELYRDLSEYVHGNHHTWITGSEALKIEEKEIALFNKSLKSFFEIANFALCLRYLKSLKKTQLEQVEPIIMQTLNHVAPILQHLTSSK
jgi:virulence-associated protein VapD